MIIRRLSILLAVAATAAWGARGEMAVSLLTCDPGRDVYELEGHTAMRFTDPDEGLDMVVNWGIFDFNSPGFVFRFVKGETDYMAGATYTDTFLRQYASEGRGVSEQQLRLDSAEVKALYELVSVNLLPDNRTYRYKYLTDNCATRPLALIERATGVERLESSLDRGASSTWRNEMRRYHRNYPWYQFGIDLALGCRLDAEIDSRQRIFAPVYLSRYLAGTAIAGPAVEISPGSDWGRPADPTPWYLTPMAVATAVLTLTCLLAVRSLRSSRLPRWYISAFFTLQGLAGCLVAFLVFVSSHEATAPNWVLLWLNPLCLLPAAGIWLKKLNHIVFCYQIVNFAFLTALLLIFATGIQSPNPAFLPWIFSDMTLAALCIKNLSVKQCRSKTAR